MSGQCFNGHSYFRQSGSLLTGLVTRLLQGGGKPTKSRRQRAREKNLKELSNLLVQLKLRLFTSKATPLDWPTPNLAAMVSVVNNLSFRRRLLFALSFPTGLFAADFITAYTTENTSTPAFLMSAAALGGYVVASRRARIHKLAILESLNAGKPSVSQYHRGRRFIQKCYMSVFGSLASSALLYAVWTESENQLRQAWNSKGVLYDFATAVFSPSEEQRIQRMEEQAVPGSQLTRARRSYWHRLVDEATTSQFVSLLINLVSTNRLSRT